MQTTRFVVFQLANFFLFFFSGKYLNGDTGEWRRLFFFGGDYDKGGDTILLKSRKKNLAQLF